ncbi:MAG TPA: cupredoxin domain-containing protein [Acidobacteriaceae bacterium]|nr:cupredoxin domain-containing protein [Acidobacteriaceae bacterium]
MKKKWMLPVLLVGIVAELAFSSPAAWRQQTPQRVEVTARRFAFTPSEITVKKGQPVVLVLKSEDVAHGIRFRELDVNLKVKAGGSAEVEFTPEKTGDFVGHCSVFCGAHHGSMAIRLHVVE